MFSEKLYKLLINLTKNNIIFFMLMEEKQKWATLEEGQEEILDQERCIKLFALNAVRNAKFHSNLLKANLFTAENATEKRRAFD